MKLNGVNTYITLKVSTEAKKGNITGYIHSKNCTDDCPESCTLWTVWNGTAWEEDATLSVQCRGN